MPKPFADDGLWPDPDEGDESDGLALADDEDGEALASNSSQAATGDLATIDALLARTGRLLGAF
jgi:hypothetical protein